MDQENPETLSFDDVRERLRVDPATLRALLYSGLLGNWTNNSVPSVGVEHFRRYGTQWRTELGERKLPGEIFTAPIAGHEQPSFSRGTIQISPEPDGLAASEDDFGWLAQFYLKPNFYFFADPGAFSLVGPTIALGDRWREVMFGDDKVYLFPDGSGTLALAMMSSGKRRGPAQDAFPAAYDVIGTILDELALSYDCPLPVVQTIAIGVPSGTISIFLPFPPRPQAMTDVASIQLVPLLRDATAFYREGISSNNPFYQFLALWKAYENAVEVRGDWRRRVSGNRRDGRCDVIVEEESFPKLFAFGGYEALSFGEAKNKLRSAYRNAIAHGTLINGKPLTAATAKDYLKVSEEIPVIRHMSRVTIKNLRASLLSKPA